MITSLPSYRNLEDIVDGFSGLLLDAYGVFWCSNAVGAYPGAQEAMQMLMSKGKIVGVLSNSSQLVLDEVEKLKRHGIVQGIHFHFFVTSGEVARATFLQDSLPFPSPRKTFYLFGSTPHRLSSHGVIFRDTVYRQVEAIQDADFVYVSVPHVNDQDQIDQEVFRKEVEKVRAHRLPMVCANPDRFAMEGKPPRSVVRAGSIAAMYEEMGGGPVLYIGKPHERVYAEAMHHFQKFNVKNPKDVLMIGDTPETDIRGANQCGMSSALVTHTGITAEKASCEGLQVLLERLSPLDRPTYLIERFSCTKEPENRQNLDHTIYQK